jgi:hypothetical protein
MAAQLISRKGFSRRLDLSWISTKLLAGAGLALDEHARRVRVGHLLRDLVDALDGRAHAADEVDRVARPVLAAQVLQLTNQLLRLEPALDQHLELIEVHRLGDEVERPGLHRPDRRGDIAVGGHDDDRKLLVDLLDLPEHVEPVHVAELQVEEDEIGRAVAQALKGLSPALGAPDLVPGVGESVRNEVTDRLLVVNHVDDRRHARTPPDSKLDDALDALELDDSMRAARPGCLLVPPPTSGPAR